MVEESRESGCCYDCDSCNIHNADSSGRGTACQRPTTLPPLPIVHDTPDSPRLAPCYHHPRLQKGPTRLRKTLGVRAAPWRCCQSRVRNVSGVNIGLLRGRVGASSSMCCGGWRWRRWLLAVGRLLVCRCGVAVAGGIQASTQKHAPCPCSCYILCARATSCVSCAIVHIFPLPHAIERASPHVQTRVSDHVPP